MVGGIHLFWELSPAAAGRQTGREADRQAVPLAATQDTSGEERQDPCPVLQPLAQPTGHLQLRPATADPLRRGRQGDREEGNEEARGGGGGGTEREIKSITIDSVCETVGADGRQQEAESDREWWERVGK